MAKVKERTDGSDLAAVPRGRYDGLIDWIRTWQPRPTESFDGRGIMTLEQEKRIKALRGGIPEGTYERILKKFGLGATLTQKQASIVIKELEDEDALL